MEAKRASAGFTGLFVRWCRFACWTEIRCLAVDKAWINSTVPCTLGHRIENRRSRLSTVSGCTVHYTVADALCVNHCSVYTVDGHCSTGLFISSGPSILNPMAKIGVQGTVLFTRALPTARHRISVLSCW
jgi:hypothetical protein